ncbi:type IV secretory system conjugative DNA transfer family protein [Pseudovibrio sp. Tun.PSC04-5.I4]|uniref:type IV secretory system conjugative DNA transfer family protein n=1 Tax=Pseudovibrio sp. Tun.PSC04-5.I4 TaxID=1798213 RepID=UPI0008865361|nr:type IV secretory system conjugative DNA transfer family protein [Pseudovibrio sp. Tun.PSC04-5.I4]SDR49011.1 type IV secretion system protein VirD4 [Pseudovibrio sp. Tun.PSC04-5.I4]
MMQAISLFSLVVIIGGTLTSWYVLMGFDPLDPRWWVWIVDYYKATKQFPNDIAYPFYASSAAGALVLLLGRVILARAGVSTLSGDHGSNSLHGSAKWATKKDISRSGLLNDTGIVVGGFKGKTLRHDGPEHALAFAPTRSGKGVSLVLPTLLSWRESAIVLDIKGENYALTAGWRESQGQRVLCFSPASIEGSLRYNPLEEVRMGSLHEIADCQNIALMIIDPDGKGLKDFWMQEGYAWLATAILHVLYRIMIKEGRTATLADVKGFMSVGDEDLDDPVRQDQGNSEQQQDEDKKSPKPKKKGAPKSDDDSFERLLVDMENFKHGRKLVDDEVRIGASRMRKRAGAERSGVHSTGTSQLAVYADPIVAKNTSDCDFRINDLMNGETPTTLYLIIPPSQIERMQPLLRIIMNQILSRLTDNMEFENGASKKHYSHRLLLLMDEFTAIGKLEIFEKGLAYMAGYGLKAFLIIQDLTQLHKVYGKEEAITSNCHVRVAFAPNRIETAKLLSDMSGKTTVVSKKRSASTDMDKVGTRISESISEVARPLMTADECMQMRLIGTGGKGKRVAAGEMLVFVAGHPTIFGEQTLYFEDKELLRRAQIPPPSSSPLLPAQEPQKGPASNPAKADPEPSDHVRKQAILSRISAAAMRP